MSNLRISGLASGFDTEKMVKDLMKAESMRLDRVKQDKQWVSWQQEAFRGVIDKLRGFQGKFLDVLKPAQNMMSLSSFSKFNYSVTSVTSGAASSAVKVTATASSTQRDITINSISKLASKDSWSGSDMGVKGIESVQITDINTFKTDVAAGLSFRLAIGSNTKVISLNATEVSGLTSVSDLSSALNGKISTAFGSDFSSVVSFSGNQIKLDFSGSELKVFTEGTDAASMTALGFASGQSSLAYRTKGIGELFGFNQATLDVFSVNGKTIPLAVTDTITQMIEKINKSDAGVVFAYNSLSHKLTMTATSEGSANNVAIDSTVENTAIFSTLFGSEIGNHVMDPVANPLAASRRSVGQNASLLINGVSIIKSSNQFTLDGINFSLQEETLTAVAVNISTNVSEISDNIKSFVSEYNGLLDEINGLLVEKRDRDYRPLTDDQRESLSEKEIEKWEENAKKGLLGNSRELSDMVSRMRMAMTETVLGAGLSLREIGISGTSYQDRGKLTIDDTKLQQMLESNFDDVVKLFTQATNSANGEAGYGNEGLARRLDTILKDNVRTTRNTQGQKGILINLAGMLGDSSVTQNLLSRSIFGFDTRINRMMDVLMRKEDSYFRQFARMESSLGELQNQASSLSSQLGMG